MFERIWTSDVAPAVREIARNLFTNPRCVASGGTVEVRRNLATNPKCGTGTNQWFVNTGTGGVASGARVTGLAALGFPVDTGYRATWTTGATSNTGIIYSDSTVVQNTAYSVGVSILATKSMSMRVRLVWRTTVGGSIISQVNGPVVVVAAGVVTLVQIANATAPATAANLSLVIDQTDAAAQPGPGDAITASAVLIEAGSALRPYFDGDGPSPDPDLTPAWLGAVNGSASVLRGQSVAGGVVGGVGRVLYRSTQFAPTPGSASIAIRRTGSVVEAAAGVVIKPTVVAGDLNKPWTVASTAQIPTGYDATSDRSVTLPNPSRTIYLFGNTSGQVQAPATPGVHELRAALTPTDVAQTIRLGGGGAADQIVRWGAITIVDGTYDGPAFHGSSGAVLPNADTYWDGAVDGSVSVLFERDLWIDTATWTPKRYRGPSAGWVLDDSPEAAFVAEAEREKALAAIVGSRSPEWTYQLYSASDEPLDLLQGVTSARIDLQASTRLGGSGSIDLDHRGQNIDWMNWRLQLVYDPGVKGWAPWPVATMLLTSPKESHHADGRTSYEAALLPKTSVLEEDAVPATYSINAGTNILEAVEEVIRSAGESMVLVTSSPAVLPKAMFWDPDTPKLTIVNDLLAAAGYMPVWVDGGGWFRLDPWVAPAERDIVYQFQAGETSIHSPEWNREQDLSSVPNRFLVVGHGTDKVPALVGDARNTDPESPFSYQARGERWIVRSESGVDAASQAEYNTLAQQRLVEAMSPVAQLEVDHEMVPVTVNQLVSFTPSGGETKLATVESMSISTELTAMVKAKWSEVAVIDA